MFFDAANFDLLLRVVDRAELRAMNAMLGGEQSAAEIAGPLLVAVFVTHCGAADLPVHVCVTQADGHQAWSSPIYLIAQLNACAAR